MADRTDQAEDVAASFSAAEVRHLASLTRIRMTDGEVEEFRHELAEILSHIQALASVDTEGVPPTNNGADLLNVQREDASRASMSVERVLANAPRREDDYFRVHAVLADQ